MSRDSEKSIADFVRLTEPCHKQLYGIALSLCKDADQAKDLTQETLIKAFEAFPRYRPGESILPWLRKILRNLFLDTFKTGRARHEISEKEMNSASQLFPFEIADDSPDPLAKLEKHQLASWVQDIIATLDLPHQQVLQLCVMQDLSFEEAAEIAGIPVGTIASRLARARAQLREQMLKRASKEGRLKRTDEDAFFLDEKDTLARIP